MTELAALQKSFAARLLARERPAGGMGIYHDNRRANFRHALALAYPALRRLVGDEYFARLATQFLASEPSRSGDLHHAGAGFAAFVSAQFSLPGTAPRHACLGDVAALEWAWQEVFVAADAPVLDPATLASTAESQWPRLRFDLHPACRLVGSRYPIHALWTANREVPDDLAHEIGDEVDATVDLDAGAEYVFLTRPRHEILVRCLTAAEYEFLRALQDSATLAEATDRASAANPQFDLLGTLVATFRAGAITQCASAAAPLGSAPQNT